jgi:hypothetical protein
MRLISYCKEVFFMTKMTNKEKFITLVNILARDKEFVENGDAYYAPILTTCSPEDFDKFVVERISYILRRLDDVDFFYGG